MKKIILNLIVILVIFVCLGCQANKELAKYKAYYQATENLLNELETQYNWVDAIDNIEYYEAVSAIKN